MIRLKSQSENVPSPLFAFCFKQLVTANFELASENRLSSLWTPDEMIDDQMDSMFIPLIFKLGSVCRFHSRYYTAKTTNCQCASG